jgi:hypothetical protein
MFRTQTDGRERRSRTGGRLKLERVRLPIVGALFLTTFLGQGVFRLWAQAGDTTGALTGGVANSAGALLPGATVRLINDATGQMQTANTDPNGRYGFLSLNPGSYALQFFAEGFKPAKISDIIVNVSEETGVSAQLEPGASQDPIACQCVITHSATSSGGGLIDSKAITAAPLTSRNVTQAFTNAAGAAGDVNNAGLLGNRNQAVNVNGQNGSNFTVDGARSGATPNPDTISQFRIQTTQYDAAYGAWVPTTNLITRSGTNDWHGALWEFVRNNIFNANDYFSKALGQGRPDLKQNQFGGALGGPLKQDRLFLFGSYQGTRQINGLDPTSLSTVILPPLTNDRSAATIGSQFCSFPTFAGGTQVACNGSNINPVALKILQMKLPDGTYVIPTPQVIQSNGLGRSFFSQPSFWNEDHYLGNMDYVISTKHSLAGRFLYSRVNQLRTFGASSSNPSFTPGGPQNLESSNYVASLKVSTVLTSKLVNEARMTFNQNRTVGAGPGIPTATSLDMVPVNAFFDEVPQISVQGSLGAFQFFGNSTNDDFSEEINYSWADNLSWIHGKHAMRTGVFIIRENENHLSIGVSRGKISFQNFTDFLLGLSAAENRSPGSLSNIDSIQANEGAGARGEVQNRRRTSSVAAFLQDDIKLHPRLTLNVGLRWERLPPTYDLLGQMGDFWYSLLSLVPIPPASGTYVGNNIAANYNPNTINPHTGKPFGPSPAGVLVRSTNGLYLDDGPLNTFAPRIAAVWQPGNKQGRIYIRAGYGWFFQPATNGTFIQAPSSQDFTNSSASNQASNLSKPFPTTTLGFELRTPNSQLSHRIAGPVYKVPTVQQWNLTVQLTLFRNLTLDVGYVGSHGTHLQAFRNRSLNQPVLASPGHPVNCGLPNTPTGLGVSNATFATLGIDAVGCVTTNTSANAYLRTPIVGESPTSLALNDSFASSHYDGLQTTLRKQVSRGLSFQASYTFSKSLSNTGTWLNDQNDPRMNWIPTNRAQRFVFSYSYEIPKFVYSGALVDKLLAGWSVSGVTSIQSGTPLTLTDRSAGSAYGRTGNATITICPGATYKDLQTSGRESARLNQWFNNQPICSAPIIGSDGLATGYGNTRQGIVTGPGQNDWDISVGKATQVGGIHADAQLQLRVEFYNAFNHPQFSNPGTTFGTANFGVITSTSVAPRLIQFGIKYVF